MTVHTILLTQKDQSPASRTYFDYETIASAMDNIAGLYEQKLQQENPRLGEIQYRAEDLFHFIDSHKEFVALVFDPSSSNYRPRDKEWIKQSLLRHFSNARSDPPQPRQQHQQQRSRGGGGYHRQSRRW
ncbi:enhancer of rudimentary-domain-containing protein [Syncephalastrum racemosum]|uniref:Enhancer of rudimentary-domain-containing protein n=1 Tax=Syncephalastrum racemosum TaxID=13706 RepID=A0A1X2HGR1_SYNRA|nr:enhancer of rudimentary-domain-containing protein [Syncephalastrum racemosum]